MPGTTTFSDYPQYPAHESISHSTTQLVTTSQIRTLHWGDFEPNAHPSPTPGRGESDAPYRRGEERIWYHWKGKSWQRCDEFPAHVWEVILDYLRIADRLDSIRPQDYIFTPLNDHALNLPNVHPGSWDQGQPLSMRSVGRLLKKYARRAGLDPYKVTVHTLRHTAAMLRKQAGDDIEKISAFLAHSSLSVTQIYLHRVEGQQDVSWAKVEALLGLSS